METVVGHGRWAYWAFQGKACVCYSFEGCSSPPCVHKGSFDVLIIACIIYPSVHSSVRLLSWTFAVWALCIERVG